MRVERIGDAVLYLADCREVLPTLERVDLLLTDPPYVIKHSDGGGFAAARAFYAGGALDGLCDFDLQEYAPLLRAASDQIVVFGSRDQISDYANWIMLAYGNYDLHFWHKINAIPFTTDKHRLTN